MPRVIWKGAISFGLVHVPVSLYSAAQESGVDFDWLDRRSMDPVGYKRVNKRTGREIKREDIVKGVKLADGDYVVISDQEIMEALPRSTQTIAIETFVESSAIPFTLLERPFYLEPAGKADRVYALLREAMLAAGVIGVARLVMHNKEHLAVLVPAGAALVLNTIRWANEIRPIDELRLPVSGKSANSLKPAELKMAAQLIRDMTGEWAPQTYHDSFSTTLRALIERKREAGKTETVAPLEESPAQGATSNVVDLTELLKRSLLSRKSIAKSAPASQSRKPGKLGKAGKADEADKAGRAGGVSKSVKATAKSRAAKSSGAVSGRSGGRAKASNPGTARKRA